MASWSGLVTGSSGWGLVGATSRRRDRLHAPAGKSGVRSGRTSRTTFRAGSRLLARPPTPARPLTGPPPTRRNPTRPRSHPTPAAPAEPGRRPRPTCHPGQPVASWDPANNPGLVTDHMPAGVDHVHDVGPNGAAVRWVCSGSASARTWANDFGCGFAVSGSAVITGLLGWSGSVRGCYVGGCPGVASRREFLLTPACGHWSQAGGHGQPGAAQGGPVVAYRPRVTRGAARDHPGAGRRGPQQVTAARGADRPTGGDGVGGQAAPGAGDVHDVTPPRGVGGGDPRR